MTPKTDKGEADLNREAATGVSREAPRRRLPSERRMREQRTSAVAYALMRCATQHSGFPNPRQMAEAAVTAYETAERDVVT